MRNLSLLLLSVALMALAIDIAESQQAGALVLRDVGYYYRAVDPAQAWSTWLGELREPAVMTGALRAIAGHLASLPLSIAAAAGAILFWLLGRSVMRAGRPAQITADAGTPAVATPTSSAVASAGENRSQQQANPAPAAASRAPAAAAKAPPNRPEVSSQFKTKDTEFLPAALEILVAPPSPVAIWLYLLICAGATTAIVWAYFGWLDIHAIAMGKIQPSGYTKVVQPLESGKVVAINVENGRVVAVNDVLVELDPTETRADRDALARDLQASQAEAARRRLAVQIVLSGKLEAVPIPFTSAIGTGIRNREQDVLSAEIAQLAATVASFHAQTAERQAMKRRLQAGIDARQKLLELARERVEMRQEIETRGAGSRAHVIESMQQLQSLLTTDAGERGQLIEVEASENSLRRRSEEALAQFVADQTQKLAEIERKRDRFAQELIKAQSRSARTQLRAPIAGTVQQLSVTTIGQVVTSGQSLMTIVPIDGPIELEAMITNRDIGFVRSGQSAVVKIEAFPFTRYGTLEAEVVRVSRDAVDEHEAASTTDAATVSRGQRGQQSVSRSQNLVFPATLKLKTNSISVDGQMISLTPGMTATVEITTGRRRVLDYLLGPLREIGSSAGRER